MPGSGGDCDQMNVEISELAIEQTASSDCLEKRPIGLVKDHAHADHTGLQEWTHSFGIFRREQV
jgi:hypothetical protein